ncbi:MAG: transcriptional regulator [Candidatus Bathyarchaeota archaeon]|nr:transcriptional regulator [Candidatus Bathyarchaeota archaeon]MDH5494453.1 transcriptional regulator [Candidatus Bathyarchaeota archaeon]
MKLPCEVAVKSVVPAIRALLAKELTKTYGMKQKEAANLLGITQTAVSKYTHHVRGRILLIEKHEEVKTQIVETAASLANGNIDRTTLILRICTACQLIREKHLMCKLCKRADPALDIKQCKLCFLSSCDLTNLKSLKKHAEQNGTEQ